MQTIQARRSKGVWRLARGEPSLNEAAIDASLLAAQALGRARLEALFHSLGRRSGIWQLEATKAAIDQGEVALGLAEQLADACAASETDSCEVHGPRAALNMRTAKRAMQARGLVVAGASSSWIDSVRFAAAIVPTFVAFLGTLLRYGIGGARLPAGAALVFAVHGEWSNRSRHILNLLRHGALPSGLLVVGRPRTSLRSLQADWARLLGIRLPPLIRPFSLGSGLAALPEAFRLLLEGLRLSRNLPWTPTLREQSAQAYRVFLGAASARWWRGQNPGAGSIVYGHTGLVDTTLLELAQQAVGSATVHIVHGISDGINFTGFSTKSWWRCGHDARWHRDLGGYGACCCAFMTPPDGLPQGDGVLLLTNLAHPMNPSYRRNGIQPEAAVLELVSEATIGALPARPMFWRPHPEFHNLPKSEQHALRSLAESLGYKALMDDASYAAALATCGFVLATPSTVVVDLLAKGHVVLLLDVQPAASGSALSIYPFRAKTATQVAQWIIESPRANAVQLRQAWTLIEPGAGLHPDCLTVPNFPETA